jgi:hypothetical protein
MHSAQAAAAACCVCSHTGPGQRYPCAYSIDSLVLVYRYTRSHTCPAAHAHSVPIGGPVQTLSSASAMPCVRGVATLPGYLAMRHKQTAAGRADVCKLSAARHICSLVIYLAPSVHQRPLLTTPHTTHLCIVFLPSLVCQDCTLATTLACACCTHKYCSHIALRDTDEARPSPCNFPLLGEMLVRRALAPTVHDNCHAQPAPARSQFWVIRHPPYRLSLGSGCVSFRPRVQLHEELLGLVPLALPSAIDPNLV